MKWFLIGFLWAFLALLVWIYVYPIVSNPFLSSLKKWSFVIRDAYVPLTNFDDTEENFIKEASCYIGSPSRIMFTLLSQDTDSFDCSTQPHNISVWIRTEKNDFLIHGIANKKTWCGSLYEPIRWGWYISTSQKITTIGALIEEKIVVDKNYFILPTVYTTHDNNLSEIDISHLPECEPNL